jgi:sarcosine oxidase subunit gamma
MLELQQPFDPLIQGGDTRFVTMPDIEMTWLSGWGFLLLQSPSESALEDALVSHTGLRLPAPQTASAGGDCALLWLTPQEWLLAFPASETESLDDALTRRLATALVAVTDMSDALAVCELSGTRCADVLMSGCALDLHSDAFPAGHSARTGLADIPSILWNPGKEPRAVRCIVDRSHARHLHDWLADAAG